MASLGEDELGEFVRAMRGDPWAAGDILVDWFPPGDYPIGKAKNDLHAALDSRRRDIFKLLGEDVSVATMRQYRATALAWPHEIRISSATFAAHQQLRGRADRQDVIANYAKRSKREGSIKLNHRQVARFRSEDNPRPSPTKTQAQKVSQSLRRAAKRTVLGGRQTDRDDWWNTSVVTVAEKESLLREIERLAADIRKSITEGAA